MKNFHRSHEFNVSWQLWWIQCYNINFKLALAKQKLLRLLSREAVKPAAPVPCSPFQGDEDWLSMGETCPPAVTQSLFQHREDTGVPAGVPTAGAPRWHGRVLGALVFRVKAWSHPVQK